MDANQQEFLSQIVFPLAAIAISIGSSAFTLFMTKKQFDHARFHSDSQAKWSMRNAALQYSIGQHAHLRDANAHLNEKLGTSFKGSDPIPYDELFQHMQDDPKLESSLLMILANFESMGVSIHCGVADNDVAYAMHGAPVRRLASRYSEYIQHRRDAEQYPQLFEHLSRLVQEWQNAPATFCRMRVHVGHIGTANKAPD